MFDKFGAMTFDELLSTAEQLKDKGDIKSLTLLAMFSSDKMDIHAAEKFWNEFSGKGEWIK